MAKQPPMITQEEQDALGYDHDMLDAFPSEGVFEKAIAEQDRPRLIWWYRFLRDPQIPRECEMVAEIIGTLEDSVPGDHHEIETLPAGTYKGVIIEGDPTAWTSFEEEEEDEEVEQEPLTPAEILGELLDASARENS